MSLDPAAAQQRIAALERELALARNALEDFTQSVSHDLRAPLRHVSSYLKIVREDLGDGLPPDIAAHLQTASDAAALIGQQIDGLLLLARLGRAELQWAPVGLGRLVDDVRQLLAQRYAGRHIEWRIAADLPALHGDLVLLGQMFTQLLDNACKFSAGSAPAIVSVSAQPEAGPWCLLEIADNGVGYDPRFQDRLFRVFQRLHSSKQFDGLGLGLAHARLVVERHGGSITAQGAPGAGCRITLRLPLQASACP